MIDLQDRAVNYKGQNAFHKSFKAVFVFQQ